MKLKTYTITYWYDVALDRAHTKWRTCYDTMDFEGNLEECRLFCADMQSNGYYNIEIWLDPFGDVIEKIDEPWDPVGEINA